MGVCVYVYAITAAGIEMTFRTGVEYDLERYIGYDFIPRSRRQSC